MNKRAAVSIRAICNALPFEPDGMLLMFVVFGSQVRGTDGPQSDLDVLYVTRTESSSFYDAVYRTILGAPDGVRAVSIFAHTPQTIRKFANLYGTVEHGILHGTVDMKTLYKSDSADLDGLVRTMTEADYAQCARQWMEMSETIIFNRQEGPPPSLPGLTCFLMRQAIDYLLRACLLSAGIRFPFTRDMRVLYDLLPPERRMQLDLGALARWGRYVADGDGGRQAYTDGEASSATSMAKGVHAFVERMI